LRVDQALVDRGLVTSRALAKRLIEAGAVRLAGKVVTKPSDAVHESEAITVASSFETAYVSRAGAKLAGALKHCGIKVDGRVCLDLGQSTGGFTDCLLKHGASKVIGIDVGHGQLAAALRSHPSVVVVEGCNIRDLDLRSHTVLGEYAESISLVVIDLSFISLSLIFPVTDTWFSGRKKPIEIVSLVKPQFEVGKGNVSRQGIVSQLPLLDGVREKIFALAQQSGWRVGDYFDSTILGGDGNREFFFHAFID
jgi:23S rRNA (cytidine1920-2'-O)/16S rRNA (cytidine1409-2'-O)-methyltransferase